MGNNKVLKNITPDAFREAAESKNLKMILQPFDEIELTTDLDEPVRLVCGYVAPSWGRFIFKEIWNTHVMDFDANDSDSYYNSAGRMYVWHDVLPHITADWRELFRPRRIVENIIGGRQVEYYDRMWIPSATDVFGVSEERYWYDLGYNFQLPIFLDKSYRLKSAQIAGVNVHDWWLRSTYSNRRGIFMRVDIRGNAWYNSSYFYNGILPGVDIGVGPQNDEQQQ